MDNGSAYLYENGSSGVVMTREPKPRLRWTADLHQHFVDVVTKLGGPHKATPKSVLRLMGIKDLTLFHLKSHLQKYRLGQQAKKQYAADRNKENRGSSSGKFSLHSLGHSTSSLNMNYLQGEIPISEAVMCQIEVQKRLQQQLEVQQKLQMRMEAQGKYMQAILENAQKKNLPISMNSSRAALEATTFLRCAHFNLPLTDDNHITASKRTHDSIDEELPVQEQNIGIMNFKLKEASINLDLNSIGSYGFIGGNAAKLHLHGSLETYANHDTLL